MSKLEELGMPQYENNIFVALPGGDFDALELTPAVTYFGSNTPVPEAGSSPTRSSI